MGTSSSHAFSMCASNGACFPRGAIVTEIMCPLTPARASFKKSNIHRVLGRLSRRYTGLLVLAGMQLIFRANPLVKPAAEGTSKKNKKS